MVTVPCVTGRRSVSVGVGRSFRTPSARILAQSIGRRMTARPWRKLLPCASSLWTWTERCGGRTGPSPTAPCVLGQLQQAGIVVVLVSARQPAGLRPYATAAGGRGLAVCSNGAILYDLERAAVLRHTLIDPPVLRRLVQNLRQTLPGSASRLYAAWTSLRNRVTTPPRGSSTTARPRSLGPFWGMRWTRANNPPPSSSCGIQPWFQMRSYPTCTQRSRPCVLNAASTRGT